MENMKVGRELDALVAEKVMGFDVRKHGNDWIYIGEVRPGGTDPQGYPVPNYSEDISAAWKVVEKLAQTRHITVNSAVGLDASKAFVKLWRCEIDLTKHSSTEEFSDSAPHAICLAALKAFE
jgi:hypothetical protein